MNLAILAHPHTEISFFFQGNSLFCTSVTGKIIWLHDSVASGLKVVSPHTM
jgi:hypothetical protein